MTLIKVSNKNYLRVVVFAIICNLLLKGCTKIEQTTMGGDLVPPVDYINTFDTFLQVVSNNYIPADSTRLNAGNDHMAGGISADPLFGTTFSTMFFELKPPNFPFLFEHPDTVRYFDSAVLVLKFQGYYGDSAAAINYNLYQLGEKMSPDISVVPFYTLQPNLAINYSILWGQKSMRANQYRDTIFIKRGKDTTAKVINELRIPLDDERARALFFADTNTIFKNNANFIEALPGFALQAQGLPNALHYFTFTSGTKIQFYYRAKRGSSIDTISRDFVFNATCGHAVELNRNRSGAEINNFLAKDPVNGATQVYIQGTPGSMVSIDIPGLKKLSNRVIHRVELRVTELTENVTLPYSQLKAPLALYLDAEYEDDKGNFRGIPYDLNPFTKYYCFPGEGIDFGYFGGTAKKVVINGKTLTQYNFNITRYVQGLISRNEPFFDLRLSAPFYMYYKECANNNPSYPTNVFPFQNRGAFINQVGEGRIRVAGGNHPDPKIKMQLRVIYSKS
jgi:hypothetical protein